jgi:hypothetical protein
METGWLLQWLELTCTLRFRLVPEGIGSANKHEIERFIVEARCRLQQADSRLHDRAAPAVAIRQRFNRRRVRLWRGSLPFSYIIPGRCLNPVSRL